MAAGVSLLGLVPLGYVAVTAILTGAPALSALVFRARVGELLANTAGLVLITVPLCALVGVMAAWLVGRTRLAGSRAFAILLVVPLAIPAFVNSYGWVSAVPSLNGLWSGVLVAGLSYFPLVYLPTVVALRRLDPAIEESARSLGVAPLGVFFRVVLPQLRLPILGGSLIIGTAIDSASTGLFLLDGSAHMEVAAALGTNTQISFAAGSDLLIEVRREGRDQPFEQTMPSGGFAVHERPGARKLAG